MLVYFCDDNKMFLDEVQYELSNVPSFSKHEIKFVYSGRELLYLQKLEHADIVVLDIEMPHINGFDVAKELRSVSPETEIIFLTSKDELVYSSFDFKPFRFVRKKFFKEEMITTLSKCIKSINDTKVIEIPTREGLIIERIDNILCVEVKQRKMTYYLENSTIETTQIYKEVSESLSDFVFFEVYRSCLINLKYLKEVHQTEVVLSNDNKFPLSRYRVKKLREQLLSFVSEGGKL